MADGFQAQVVEAERLAGGVLAGGALGGKEGVACGGVPVLGGVGVAGEALGMAGQVVREDRLDRLDGLAMDLAAAAVEQGALGDLLDEALGEIEARPEERTEMFEVFNKSPEESFGSIDKTRDSSRDYGILADSVAGD